MIIGIGVDTVEINRFNQWHSYSIKTLQRIFSHEEIVYCQENSLKSSERFAVRFAAREALYKALCAAGVRLPFLTVCSYASIQKKGAMPIIELSEKSGLCNTGYLFHLSLSHSVTHAVAFVIIEQR